MTYMTIKCVKIVLDETAELYAFKQYNILTLHVVSFVAVSAPHPIFFSICLSHKLCLTYKLPNFRILTMLLDVFKLQSSSLCAFLSCPLVSFPLVDRFTVI
jgi:hypothetical protein